MANLATFVTSKRRYSACIGTVEYGSGIQAADGTWSQLNKVAVVAHFEETTTITRALTAIAVDADSLVMGVYAFQYGVIGYLKTASFDFEQSHVTSDCRRVSEAGFYEKTTISTICTNITHSASILPASAAK